MRAPYTLFVAAVLGVCALVSGVPIAAAAFRLADGGAWPPFDARHAELLIHSLAVAGGATLLATLLGGGLGLALGYFRVNSRLLLLFVFPAPFLVPSYILALAWIEMLGKNGLVADLFARTTGVTVDVPNLYSIGGAVWVLGLSHYPVVAAAALIGARRLDARFDEAARLARGTWPAFVAVVLPLLAPTILTGSLAVFLLTLVAFAVPSLLQVAVYPVEIHTRFAAFHDLSGGMMAGLPLFVAGALAIAAWLAFLRQRRAWLTGRAVQSSEPRGSTSLRWIMVFSCWLVVGVSAILPIAVLVWRSLPLNSYAEVWETAREEFWASVMTAAAAATLMAALGFAMALLCRKPKAAAPFAVLSATPFLLSGPALGIALITAWNHAGWRSPVYDSAAIVVLACAARFLFFSFAGAFASLRDLGPTLVEAASVAGVPRWRQVTGILFPLSLPYLVAVWTLSFLLTFGEVDTTLLVAPPGLTTLPVRIFGLLHYGPGRLVAALSVIITIIIIGAAAFAALTYLLTLKITHAPRTAR